MGRSRPIHDRGEDQEEPAEAGKRRGDAGYRDAVAVDQRPAPTNALPGERRHYRQAAGDRCRRTPPTPAPDQAERCRLPDLPRLKGTPWWCRLCVVRAAMGMIAM